MSRGHEHVWVADIRLTSTVVTSTCTRCGASKTQTMQRVVDDWLELR